MIRRAVSTITSLKLAVVPNLIELQQIKVLDHRLQVDESKGSWWWIRWYWWIWSSYLIGHGWSVTRRAEMGRMGTVEASFSSEWRWRCLHRHTRRTIHFVDGYTLKYICSILNSYTLLYFIDYISIIRREVLLTACKKMPLECIEILIYYCFFKTNFDLLFHLNMFKLELTMLKSVYNA